MSWCECSCSIKKKGEAWIDLHISGCQTHKTIKQNIKLLYSKSEVGTWNFGRSNVGSSIEDKTKRNLKAKLEQN